MGLGQLSPTQKDMWGESWHIAASKLNEIDLLDSNDISFIKGIGEHTPGAVLLGILAFLSSIQMLTVGTHFIRSLCVANDSNTFDMKMYELMMCHHPFFRAPGNDAGAFARAQAAHGQIRQRH